MDYVEGVKGEGKNGESKTGTLLIGTNGDREAQGTSILMHDIQPYLDYFEEGDYVPEMIEMSGSKGYLSNYDNSHYDSA